MAVTKELANKARLKHLTEMHTKEVMEDFRRLWETNMSHPQTTPFPHAGQIQAQENTRLNPSPRVALEMRLRKVLESGNVEYVDIHRSGDKVFVFVITGGKPVVIEDDWDLFPSDTLVTQMRVLIG